MILSLIIAIVATSISAVAAYYSIVGLAAIFAAALIPIIIMGVTLEIGKIATVVWLHTHWKQAPLLMKLYLIPGVIALMLITSMGIFGFLSKAHIEQTSATDESLARVEQVLVEITRQTDIVGRAETKITQLRAGTLTTDNAIQVQIDKEQERIDSAYIRMQPAISEQKAIIAGQTKLYEDQIASIDAELGRLQAYIDTGEIKKAQQLIGEKSKGGWGPKTAKTARLWRAERNHKKTKLLNKIERVTSNNSEIIASRNEIKRLRQNAEQIIADSNTLINRLRDKLGSITAANNIDKLIEQQYTKIAKALLLVDALTEEQYKLQSAYRKLEAEVGPIKYIAELIYGENAGDDRKLLEEAVRLVIIVLVIVFDPLAIMLILAASSSYKWHREKLEGDIVYTDETGKAHIIKLESKAAEEKERYDALMKTLQERNGEMNQLRVELNEAASQQDVEAVNKLAAKLEDVEFIRDELIQEFQDFRDQAERQLKNASVSSDENDKAVMNLVVERDNLQRELNQLADEIDIVQKEIEKVPLLEREIQKQQKQIQIYAREKHTINILAPGTEASLRHKIQLLSNRITSMIGLSDFDLKSAQELVEVKQQKLDVERRFEELSKKYDDLVK